MSAVTSTTSFRSRLQNCRLVDDEQLKHAFYLTDNDDRLAEYLLNEGLLTRFQVRQLRAGSTSLTVGKYVIVDCIGRGGNGIVLKARHQSMPDRFVAIKTIDTTSLHHDDEATARFRREIDIVSRLDHPNIVRGIDVIQTRSRWYLVMEFVDGKSLSALVEERGPLPVPEAVHYVIQAAWGLAYVHERGIVHRDIKPTNLLLASDGVIKVLDLGLARDVRRQHAVDLTCKGRAMGTPDYMSPEQAEDASSAGPLSDLYSLGATMFHLLSGRLPVAGSSYMHKLQQLLMSDPIPMLKARSDVPVGLAGIVDRLRARDPQDRPQSAAETISLLEPYLKAPDKKRTAEFAKTPQAESVPVSGDPEELISHLYAKIGAQQLEIERLRRQMNS